MANNNLFPADIDNDVDFYAESYEESAIGYKKAPYFDSELGDFALDGSGKIIDADEITAYTQWCEAVIATDRYNHDAYTSDIGIDYNAVFKAKTHEEAEAILESEISEALAVDPCGRTNYVQNVTFEWLKADELHVLVEVMALDNELVTIDTVIKM